MTDSIDVGDDNEAVEPVTDETDDRLAELEQRVREIDKRQRELQDAVTEYVDAHRVERDSLVAEQYALNQAREARRLRERSNEE
jgi:hypothetical protein